ncbi:flagellar hook-length control protein FliK [Bordetella sp. 2513F-2]
MSIGPPALGNVLVQRLDAVLGTTMASHPTLVSGARPDAVSQPGEAAPPARPESATREPRQAVDPAQGRAGGQRSVADAKTAAALALAARGLVTSDASTASAPTTLGQTARTILALLARYPDPAPPVTGRQPLWQPPAPPAAGAQPGARQPGTQPAAPPAAAPAAPDSARAGASGRPAPAVASPADDAAPAAAARASGNAPPPALLAQALRLALQHSGLFYESHLSQLAFGRLTPDQLAAEPQARLGALPDAQAQNASAPGGASPRPLPAGEDAGAPSGPAGPAPGGTSSGGSPLSGIHPDATLLVRQQLDALANQALAWQGQPWPGAEMEWEVRRDPALDTPDAPEHWATRIRLELPRLGLVEARLTLAGNQLVMQVLAPLSAAELGRHADALRQGMLTAGLTLSQLDVAAVPPSPPQEWEPA